ncbi:hypothetical protein [Paramaledivibacter caminithermalis]|uniref:Uncharacterized protein n=1 Tax=Paramaledivibacter caminithermalis (strain DSM 15212 / CIP 107654 / DViRD3) TaxID=1121301 RepID=A0A1M6RYZ6_PARC5|nr:hypothetical protein [Paramaledivibacter caminithermalis]SHK37640.1 hypothetical protein SAMN02745912_03119 [Paramaledivibacter caminithermalis DSM 15212]
MFIFIKIIIGVVAIIILSLGIMMLRKKPIFIKGYLMTILLGTCYFPTLMLNFIRPIFWGDFDPIGLLFVALFIFLIFVLKKSFGDYMIFNIEEDILYEALFTALKEEGIEYEDKRGKIIIPYLSSEIKISTHSIFTTANVHLRFKDNKEISMRIIDRVKNILSRKTMDKVPLNAIVYIACSIFLIILLIWMISF